MRLLKFVLFNKLVSSLIAAFNSLFSGFSKRLRSMASELLYVLIVFVPWIIPFQIINQILTPPLVIGQPFKFGPLDGLLRTLGLVLWIGILNKDFFNGQSPIKRINGYQVVDVSTLQPANKIKCLVRNVTALLWPIEAIFALINPQRRIGDFIAGTKLIEIKPSVIGKQECTVFGK
jgi:hypothetical protein